VVSNLILQALRGEDLTIYGDGSQTRSFCYVEDMIAGLAQLMNTPDDCIGPMNIGNPVEFTILALAEEVLRLTGSKSRIVHHPLPQDDPVQRKPDITQARNRLKWNPSIPLEEGLRRTIEYFQNTLS
jgi:UDP-glucuronate decarboxylase